MIADSIQGRQRMDDIPDGAEFDDQNILWISEASGILRYDGFHFDIFSILGLVKQIKNY